MRRAGVDHERGGRRMSSIQNLPAVDVLARAEEDFAGAELTLLYDRVDAEDKRLLVFAVVELLHENLEFGPELPVDHRDKDSYVRLGKSGHELNLRRVRLPVREALEWYRRCAAGQGTVPRTAYEKERSPDKAPFTLHLPSFAEEPPWPHVVLESESSFWSQAPFWGHRPGGTRRHQLIAESKNFTVSAWDERSEDMAREWLKDRFPVDIFERPRLLGSIHLVLTNPVFGKVHTRLNAEDPSQLFLQVQRWPGRALSGLRLHIRQERPTGSMALHVVPLEHSLTTLQLACDPHTVPYEIVSETHGLLYASTPSVFARQVQLSVHVERTVRQVSVPASSRKRGSETYSVSIAGAGEVLTSTSEEVLRPALDAILEDDQDFRRRKHALQLGQRWFDGHVEEATKFIRGLIQNASQDVLVIDAYFGWTELLRYALALSVRGAKMQIMTSKEYLEKKPEEDSPFTHGVLLADALRQVRAQDPSLDIEIRVGMGDKPPVHDRFLVLDEDTVWMLGSSLNELGNRGTTVIRLPHAQPVREPLLQHWAKALPLDAFMARPRTVPNPP
ncbi:VPA1262 family N-terminal domain-containing protein [Hyalangium rubrum]|uniref:VPA1262 family N-terminal domain-containing protein n=1 Tax=Hyalangium rubrum TaxID=3103134 RepID=A0ABU5H3P6_9BACT|nr:VPA1262 family N-terminal domain-containing protein [Hyalangium sp. s54d21]MDY7228078.1 VPA1262 family N-terminal domain-containing protein [Hyalangium sp. s54d21]